MALAPLTLIGKHVRLEPLSLDHTGALARVGLVPELWRLQPALIESEADMRRYVQAALDDQARGVSLPFAMLEPATGQVMGSTRYMDIALPHRRLEIGATWLAPAFQRSGANTEAKLLLLAHAFEALNMQKVVLKTEVLNTQSREAIARIGAVEEGVFRKHLIATSGRARDMVYFSILDAEWPGVKARLAARLR
jgi:N-acetyltransferase